MADDRKPDEDEKGLTPQEREFKRAHPNTWRRMVEEREEQERQRQASKGGTT